jgi:hypothetical protein
VLLANLKDPSHGFHFSLTGVALLLGAVGAFLIFGSRTNPAFEAWLQGTKDEVRTHAAWLQRTNHLAAQARSAQVAAKRLGDSVATAQARAESLAVQGRALMISAQTVPQLREANRVLASANAQCFDALTLCRRQVDSLTRADSLDKLRADSAEWRASRADSVAKAGLKVRECDLVDVGPIHVGCPSREVTGVVGLVIGLVLRSVVH